MRGCRRTFIAFLMLALVCSAFPAYAITGFSVKASETYALGPSGRLVIRWNRFPGATKYELWQAVGGGGFQLYRTISGTFLVEMRPATTIYRYKVRPILANGARGAYSAEKSVLSDLPANISEPGARSESRILLIMNKSAQVLTAYIKDANGRFTLPIRHMITSTGSPDWYTPTGTFRLSTRSQWYQYPGGTNIRYPVRFGSAHGMTLYVHSVLYNSKKKLINSTVGRLGTRQSLGCIRLKVNDASWVYSYCTSGTTLIIRDGRSIPALTSALRPKNVS